jgi:hypothetical protein
VSPLVELLEFGQFYQGAHAPRSPRSEQPPSLQLTTTVVVTVVLPPSLSVTVSVTV